MAGNQIRSDLEGLLVGIESSYGTDPTPTEGVELRGEPTTTADRVAVQRARKWGSVGRKAHAVIDDKVSFSFQVALGGAENTADGVPAVDPFLRGAGFAVATSGDPSTDDVQADYTPTSTAHESFALYRYLYDTTNGQQIRLKLLGCRCNIEIVVALNAEILVNITGQAKYAEWEAVASLTDPTSFGLSVPTFSTQNLTHTFNSTARRITSWNFATGWNIAPENDVTGAANAHEILLSAAQPIFSGSFNPVMLSSDFAASGSLIAEARGATEGVHNLAVTDGIYSFDYTASQTQIDPNLPMSTDGAHRRFDVPYYNNATDAGDDGVTLSFVTT